MRNPPPGYESHNEYLALGGVPRHIYFERVTRSDPQVVVEGYLHDWDANNPVVYRGQTFGSYHLFCDHLESTGVIRRPTPRSEGVAITSVYDQYAERDVLMWLAGNGYLARDDADNFIAMVVAPFRRDVPTQNPRARRFDGFLEAKCIKCGIETSTKQRMIRLNHPNTCLLQKQPCGGTSIRAATKFGADPVWPKHRSLDRTHLRE